MLGLPELTELVELVLLPVLLMLEFVLAESVVVELEDDNKGNELMAESILDVVAEAEDEEDEVATAAIEALASALTVLLVLVLLVLVMVMGMVMVIEGVEKMAITDIQFLGVRPLNAIRSAQAQLFLNV